MDNTRIIYDEQKIIYLLKNSHILMRAYNEKEIELLKGFETLDETIESISLKSKVIKEYMQSKTNAPSDPLFAVLDKLEKNKENMMYEQLAALKDLDKKKTELKALMSELERLNEPYREMLIKLYVKGTSWKEVRYELEISPSTFSRYRKKAINQLVENMQKNANTY